MTYANFCSETLLTSKSLNLWNVTFVWTPTRKMTIYSNFLVSWKQPPFTPYHCTRSIRSFAPTL